MNKPAKDRTSVVMARVKQYVADSIGQGCKAEEVARHFHYHPKYLSQWFKRENGQPLSAFIASVRMERAKSLLLETDQTASAIADQLGFSSSQHFFKRFKQDTKTTPIRFRSDRRRGATS
ncbi:helix-turn-helix transcriptional regulator [Cohnella sp. GCM10027633]|uniref:helix-turn-helix transcriptional regulator n=1 Tax=unclassified Cohnella TaxID=2636738 RepID=UPI003629FAE9